MTRSCRACAGRGYVGDGSWIKFGRAGYDNNCLVCDRAHQHILSGDVLVTDVRIPTTYHLLCAMAHRLVLDCFACAGSGVVVERIGREDAIADAETLRLSLKALGIACFTMQPHAALVAAAVAGFRAVRKMNSRRPAPLSAYWAAREAMHALRAVPGLRGECPTLTLEIR